MTKIIFATAIAIAAVAGFFSIYGLGNIYSAMFWSVVLMGSVLEAGKLVTVSALYQHWNKFNWSLRIAGFFFVFGLMVITSAGVFGYLSNAYQLDSVDLKDVASRIEILKTEKEELDARELQIDEDIGRVAANYITKRMELIDKYNPEKEYLSNRRKELRTEIRQLSTKQLEVEAHTGPIIYIAKALGKDVDTAIIWMTLLIVIVFDPLAVTLTLMGNIAMGRRKDIAEDVPSDDTPISVFDEADLSFVEDSDETIQPEPTMPEITEPEDQNNAQQYPYDDTPDTDFNDIIDEPNPSIVSEEQLDFLANKHTASANVNNFRERKTIDDLLLQRKKKTSE